MRQHKGQTILEVLIALTLITLFLSGIIIIQLLSLRNVQLGQKKSIAIKLANQQLERARVIRDSQDMASIITNCASLCYINSSLTPMPFVTPTGTYGQSLTVSLGSSECPAPSVIPEPSTYYLQSRVTWSMGASVTLAPAPQIDISSCLADWK